VIATVTRFIFHEWEEEVRGRPGTNFQSGIYIYIYIYIFLYDVLVTLVGLTNTWSDRRRSSPGIEFRLWVNDASKFAIYLIIKVCNVKID